MRSYAIPLLILSAALAFAALPSRPASAQIFTTPTTRPGDPTTVAAADQRLENLQLQIERLIDRPYYDSDSVRAPLNALADQRDKAMLTLAARKAREDAIQKKIDELTQQGRTQLDQDTTLAQLKQVAAAKQADAERRQALANAHTIGAADVEDAVVAAAEAQVRIQERRDAITASVGGGALAALNRELVTVSLDVSEQTALLAYLDNRMDRFREAAALDREREHILNLKNFMESNPGGIGGAAAK